MQELRTTFRRALSAAALSGALVLAAGCHSNNNAAQNNEPDPATANMAPANGQTQVLGESSSYTPQQQGESYAQQEPAPVEQAYPQQPSYYPNDTEVAGEEALEQADQAPPPLPDYDQPPAPGPDYIWTPGYWAWGQSGYYWVPGAWVEAPYYGALWTPPWWGYCGVHWCFHHGYWGPHVGYYGGIDYGFGYIGIGYFGGYWSGNHFYYNRDVTHVGGGINTVYSRPVVYNNVHYGAQPRNRVSYNGGHGGTTAHPNASEMAAAREHHQAAMPIQRQARVEASQNRAQAYNANHGRPAEAVAAHGFANSHGIAAPPRGVEVGRPAAAPGVPANRVENRPGQPNVTPNRMENRPGQPMAAPNRMENRPGQPMAAPNRIENRPGQPENRAQSQPRMENRAQPQPRVENRAQPQPRMENRPAPHPHVENRPQPQARPEARPAPQARPEPRPAPQARPEARPAPRPAPQARPQARPAPAPHPAPQHEGGHPDDHDRH